MKNVTQRTLKPKSRTEIISITQDDFTHLVVDLNNPPSYSNFILKLRQAIGGLRENEIATRIIPFVKIPRGGDYSGSTLNICDFDEGSLFVSVTIESK